MMLKVSLEVLMSLLEEKYLKGKKTKSERKISQGLSLFCCVKMSVKK